MVHTAKRNSFGQEVELGQVFFPLGFRGNIHMCHMQKQITGRREELRKGKVAQGSSLHQSFVERKRSLLQMGQFQKFLKKVLAIRIWAKIQVKLKTDLKVVLLTAENLSLI